MMKSKIILEEDTGVCQENGTEDVTKPENHMYQVLVVVGSTCD